MILCIIFIVSSWPQCQCALKADILSLDPEGARHGSRHGSNIHWDLFVLSSVCFRYVIANILFLPLYARLGVALRSAYVEASISTCVTFRGFRKKQRPWMDMIGRNVMPRSFSDDVGLGYILSILITNKRSCPGSPPRWGGAQWETYNMISLAACPSLLPVFIMSYNFPRVFESRCCG